MMLPWWQFSWGFFFWHCSFLQYHCAVDVHVDVHFDVHVSLFLCYCCYCRAPDISKSVSSLIAIVKETFQLFTALRERDVFISVLHRLWGPENLFCLIRLECASDISGWKNWNNYFPAHLIQSFPHDVLMFCLCQARYLCYNLLLSSSLYQTHHSRGAS